MARFRGAVIVSRRRYFVDGNGYVWFESQYAPGFVSMAPTNPDNSPVPEPRTYLLYEDELPTWLLMPLWQRVSYWLRPYWHRTDSRVWRWQRKPYTYVVLTGGSTLPVPPATGTSEDSAVSTP